MHLMAKNCDFSDILAPIGYTINLVFFKNPKTSSPKMSSGHDVDVQTNKLKKLALNHFWKNEGHNSNVTNFFIHSGCY